MPKAIEVVNELRKLADALEKLGENSMSRIAIYIRPDSKEQFLMLAKALPRPIFKMADSTNYTITNWPITKEGRRDYDKVPMVDVDITIDRTNVCRLVSPAVPAKYECEPLLSEIEERQLTEVA